ncbi:MAG: hypothetical protein ACLRFN_00310, partial [Alphaproteobacteria bacterium]
KIQDKFMKADAHKQVQYLRHGMEQFLADEDKHIANGAPRLRGGWFLFYSGRANPTPPHAPKPPKTAMQSVMHE